MKLKYEIVYEDNHLLIVHKPAGILVQGDKTGDFTLVDLYKKYLKDTYNKPGNIFLGLVHRIDRPVSGLVILAKTSKALERMTKLFQRREISKTYWAMVKQRPPDEEGRLTHWLLKDRQKNIARVHKSDKNGAKKAILEYRMLGRIGEFYLLEVEPLTGRPHQIRAQLAEIGCPIVGDVKYGFNRANRDGSIQLHAKALRFSHPVKDKLVTLDTRPTNSEMWKLFRDFR
ncbi:RNA pseudouridine synthase [Fulvivirgaceae bacterium BMA12]|uniref:RNA pseudouridine synthase n=1 Tax=Agaribacillus aureus TaxID=3051825 RepID=A0ABT8LBX5_9BACT|nr:RNA pseudouridine synthase [Fulvivirgaceae bacterium BMA12]